MAGPSNNAPVTGAVWGRYFESALIWLIPAALLLPFYLVLIAISVAASEGGLLELVARAKGGIHAALGLLLVLGSIVLLGLVIHVADEPIDWIEGGSMVLVTGGLGVWFMHRELRRLSTQ